jgi:hypothetical protein
MTETVPNATAETPVRAAIAGLIALGGHAVALLAGLIAAWLVPPSPGGGLQDLAAVVMAFLGVEILVGLACLITGAILFRRDRRYTGLGLIGGWLLGLVFVVALVG